MKTIASFLLFAVCHFCLADGITNSPSVMPREPSQHFASPFNGTDIIAESDWSEPVARDLRALRARMLISHRYESPWSATGFYVELQNASRVSGPPMQIYFDPVNSLHCELLDADGKPAPKSSGGFSLAFPKPDGYWIALPYDSTIRLRVDIPSKGRLISDDDIGDYLAVQLPFTSDSWPSPSSGFGIKSGDTNVYYLSGTFTVRSPTNRDVTHVGASDSEWTGTLKLPKMKVWLKRQ